MINLKPDTRTRLIKPSWSKPFLKNGLPNPEFKEELPDFDVIEGYFTKDQIITSNNRGYNTYWFPNQSKEKIVGEFRYLNGRDINDFQFVFCDMDSKDGNWESVEQFVEEVRNFEVAPTMINLSGNGVHVYWRISDLDREKYVQMQFSLINRFKTDPSLYTVLQPLRLPGTLNTKEYGNFKTTELVESNDNAYTFSELARHLPPLTETQQDKLQRHLNRLDGKIQISLEADVDVSNLPDKFLKYIEADSDAKELFYHPEKQRELGRRRSSADFILGLKLRNAGFSKEDVFQVLHHTQKYLECGNHSYLEYTMQSIQQAFQSQDLPQEKSKLPKKLPNIIKKVYGPLL